VPQVASLTPVRPLAKLVGPDFTAHPQAALPQREPEAAVY
jgi:hypothetical protein